MSYQALYRKFRPKDFDEVFGQDHIVTTLKNQLNSGRIGHAYVFSGTRGTGKTSVAKIFAKALNCEKPHDGNPCGECASCKKINEGASLNVFEVDGASNNGVDNIRSIIEDLSYPPVEGKSKIYIIDEAHMVTTPAFNALLKTIEEPPSYAVFILATTEVNRIPVTILSRCQRYDFHRITVDTIAERMKMLCEAESVQVEDRALKYIARLADGSLRDALSMLDQCISFYFGRDITFDMTLEMLGASDNEVYSRLFSAVCAYDATQTIKIVNEAIIKGKEPETFVSDFIWYLRNMLLVKNGEQLEEVADISSEDAKALLEEAQTSDSAAIMRFITILSELLADMKFAPLKKITMEIGFIRLCRPQMEDDVSGLAARIDMLEKRFDTEDESPWDEEPPWEEDEYILQDPMQQEQAPETSAAPSGAGFAWQSFLSSIPAMDRSIAAKGVVISESSDKADIYFAEKSMGGKHYSKKENSDKLMEAIDAFSGHHVEVNIHIVPEEDIPKIPDAVNGSASQGTVDILKQAELFGVTVEIED